MKRESLIHKFLIAMVVVGLVFQQAIMIHAAPGDLDTTFGSGGAVIMLAGFNDQVFAAALQTDGKIVVVGFRAGEGIPTVGARPLVGRFNTDGSLDTTFGTGGLALGPSLPGPASSNGVLTAVAVQTDGKIVAAGSYNANPPCEAQRPWIIRYNADGSLDSSFTSGTYPGVVEFMYTDCANGSIEGISIQSNGKIVVAGASSGSSGWDFAAARINSNGQFDTSFSGDGKATFSITGGHDLGNAVAINPTTGKIVLAGYSPSSTINDFTLVMLTSAGSLDTTFGGTGKVITNTGGSDAAHAVRFLSSGKILAAGRQANGTNGSDFSVARYNTNGSLDTTFDGDGKAVTPFSAYYDSAFGIALHANGQAVAAGYGADNAALQTGFNFALARYHSNGTLDTTFSGDGKQMTDLFNFDNYGRAVLIQSDQKILVAGYTSYGGSENYITLARYLP